MLTAPLLFLLYHTSIWVQPYLWKSSASQVFLWDSIPRPEDKCDASDPIEKEVVLLVLLVRLKSNMISAVGMSAFCFHSLLLCVLSMFWRFQLPAHWNNACTKQNYRLSFSCSYRTQVLFQKITSDLPRYWSLWSGCWHYFMPTSSLASYQRYLLCKINLVFSPNTRLSFCLPYHTIQPRFSHILIMWLSPSFRVFFGNALMLIQMQYLQSLYRQLWQSHRVPLLRILICSQEFSSKLRTNRLRKDVIDFLVLVR